VEKKMGKQLKRKISRSATAKPERASRGKIEPDVFL
jgi:hypothetical protein